MASTFLNLSFLICKIRMKDVVMNECELQETHITLVLVLYLREGMIAEPRDQCQHGVKDRRQLAET